MKVFVINLLNAWERRVNAARQLDSQGVRYELFQAIDGSSEPLRSFESSDPIEFLLKTGRAPVPEEIGCFASHRYIWRRCVSSNEPVLVMEDDFRLDSNFRAALAVVARVTPEFGFVRLQTESRAKRVKIRDCGRFSLHYYTKVPHGAACYCISPEVAKSFIAASSVLTAPVDVFIKTVWEHRQPIFGLLPYAVHESQFSRQSTIGVRTKAKKNASLRLARLVEKARGISHRELFNQRAIAELADA